MVSRRFGAVHVLCNNAGVAVGGPLDEATQLDQSLRNRPLRFSGQSESVEGDWIRDAVRGGIDPERVARRTLHAIQENELYVLTHPEALPLFEARAAAVVAARDR